MVRFFRAPLILLSLAATLGTFAHFPSEEFLDTSSVERSPAILRDDHALRKLDKANASRITDDASRSLYVIPESWRTTKTILHPPTYLRTIERLEQM